MKEEFLHFVWKYQLFDPSSLTDNTGSQIEVISTGDYNHDAGPDFFNSRLRIGGTEWAGNVEIHIKSSDFELHGHHRDHSFDNVILHVVWENDRRVRNARGREVLTSAIRVSGSVHDKYLNLVNNPAVIACQDEIGKCDRFFIACWLKALMVERLSGKCGFIETIYRETGNDWEETFYRLVCRYFGFRVNTGPFEMLSAALPYKVIKKHSDNLFQVESLLFGTAGLLDEGLFKSTTEDRYFLELSKEFRVLSSKYSLNPVHGWLWKFSRLRPVNFPTIRLSQLSSLLCTAGGMFSRTIESKDPGELKKLFEVTASSYWTDHYVFGKSSRPVMKRTGEMALKILLINTVIPIIFAYGKSRGERSFSDRSVEFLEKIGPESNSVISEWESAGIHPGSAADTQALVQLKTCYCRKRRCLDCRIGQRIIASGAILKNPEEVIMES
ncbi:MAG TPA: DUF2851 family protein [Bacteroidales bacterium]|nr:DUF2851 family protein [Bacteroidales bacterium]